MVLIAFALPSARGVSRADDKTGKGASLSFSDKTGDAKADAAHGEKRKSASGAKLLSSSGMVLDFVGEDSIVANERKFMVTDDTRITSRIGTQTYLRLLRLRSKLDIEYHADKSGNLVADSITVLE